MTKVDPERLEEWLEQRQTPNNVLEREPYRKNSYLLYYGSNSFVVTLNCIDTAKSEEGKLTFTQEIQGLHGHKPFKITYTVSDVTIEEFCTDEHDFGEWKYDFMGGDLRTCAKCGLTEFE